MRLFLAELLRQELAAKTLISYRCDLVAFAAWFPMTAGQSFSAAAVAPTDIRQYRQYLQTVARRTPATINRHLATLRKFFVWAKGTGLVHDNPTEAIKGVASVATAPKWLEKREVDRLTRTVEQHGSKRDQAIVAVLRHTGLRVSELAALRLGDIEISERKGQLTVRAGKRGKYRVVPVNVDARRSVAAYLEVRPAVAGDHLFVGQRGEGIQAQAIENVIRKYAQLAEMESVTPHTLRHSFGKHMLDGGTDLVAVAALLGHQRLETTAIYTRPSARDLERAVKRLESK